MRHTKEFAFEVAERVMVKEVQRPGRIECIQVDAMGTQYRVSYWDNSERKTCWLYSDEIDPR